MELQDWQKHQDWESNWWGDCVNTYNEETKQYIYSHFMGLDPFQVNAQGKRGWDMGDKSILDVGGGPVSMLIKTKARLKIVLDPCSFPKWVSDRYSQSEVIYYQNSAESMTKELLKEGKVDEVWIYNVLQHTIDPEKIIKNIRTISKTIRLFEWVDTGTSMGHPHELKADTMDEWLGGEGRIAVLTRPPLIGRAYVGIFKGDHYEKV